MTATHRLRGADFDELAAGRGGPRAIRVLAGGQLSTRLLQVRALLDAAEDDPSTDAVAARAGWQVLSELGSKRAAEVLLHPPVGAWLSRCLGRRLAAGSDDRPGLTLGHLAAIAGTAAIRAGRDVELPVPVRAGLVHLPMLGAVPVPVPSPDGHATLTTSRGAITVSTGGGGTRFRLDGPGWLPLRRISTAESGGLEVCLDDLDPYRDLPGLELAGRLEAAAVDRWRRVLDKAWSMLTQHYPGPAAELAEGLRSVVPLRDTRADQGVSATSVECFGSAAMSRPAAADVLALGLLHEFQHSKLGALLDLVPLYDRDQGLLLYAPWRDDPRPLGALLQGAYAHVGVTAFWRKQRELQTGKAARFAEFEFARWRDQCSRAVDVLARSGALTEAGRRFVAGMGTELAGCRTEPVSVAAATAAREASRDHWLTWRARNLVPDRQRVLEAVASWRADRPWPGAGTAGRPRASTFAPTPNARLTLLHIRLRDPGRFARLRANAASLVADVPHATPADLAYVDGDHAAAAAAYATALAQDPGSSQAWSGLVLAASRGEPDSDLPPELLRAVSDEVARAGGPRPDPVALAAWVLG